MVVVFVGFVVLLMLALISTMIIMALPGVFNSIDEVREIIRKWEKERESKGE